MYIQANNDVNFGTLYRGYSVEQILEKRHPKKFEVELNKIESVIKKKDLHKKENVDIILNYTKQDGFYGTISSKAEGVPMNPSTNCNIKDNKESVDRFTSWVDAWNEAYSPEELQKMHEIMDFIRNGFVKDMKDFIKESFKKVSKN